jgi:predicted CXXCH cytochrome family protein
VADGASLCLQCHDDPADGGKNVHPALEEGCLECHAAHSSDNPGLMLAEGTSLCLQCHDDPSAGLAVVHEALEEGCTACHDPHASRGPALLEGLSSKVKRRPSAGTATTASPRQGLEYVDIHPFQTTASAPPATTPTRPTAGTCSPDRFPVCVMIATTTFRPLRVRRARSTRRSKRGRAPTATTPTGAPPPCL